MLPSEPLVDRGDATGRIRPKLALVGVGVTVVVWSASAVAIKATTATGLVASCYRLWLAIAVLWLAALSIPALRRRLFSPFWWQASLGGGTLFGLHQIVFFVSIKNTSIANVVILAALSPVLVAVVSRPLLGERVALRGLLWALVAVGGTATVMLGSAGSAAWSLLGDVFAVLNLFAFTAYFLASKRLRTRVGAPEYMVGMTTVAGLIVLAVTVATGGDLASPTLNDLIILFLVALLPGTLGHLTINWAHAHTSAFAVSMLILAVPVLSSAGAALLLDEPINQLQMVGGAAVLVAIGLVQLTGTD